MPVAELILPDPHSEKQAAVVQSAARHTAVEAGTKAGKTAGAILWFLRRSWTRPGTRWWWVAPVSRQSKIAFYRIWRMLRTAGVPIEPRRGDISIRLLAQDTILEFRSGENPDTLYGDDVHGAVIDEAARFREDAFHAVRSTLTFTRGPLLAISTPRGRRNWFWNLCQKAKSEQAQAVQESRAPEYVYYHLRTIDNPYIPPEEVAEAQALLPEAVFDEMFLGQAQEDAAAVFRNVAACMDATLPVEEPWSPSGWYVAGVDLARRRDYTVIVVMDVRRRQVVKVERFSRVAWPMQKERIAAVLRAYRAAGLVDATPGSVGDPILADLQGMGLAVEGFEFSGTTKPHLVERLASEIEHATFRMPDLPVVRSELEAFGYEFTRGGRIVYSAPSGMYDDCVTALGLAVWAMGTTTGAPPAASTVGRRISAGFDG